MRIGPLVLLACLFLAGPTHVVPGNGSQGTITPDEASLIWRVEELVADYRQCQDKASHRGAVDTLVSMYESNRESFEGVVILNGLLEIESLSALESDEPPAWPLEFALLLGNEPGNISRYLKTLQNPGRKMFLESWTAFAGRGSHYPLPVAENRQAGIQASYAALHSSLAKETGETRIQKLFERLVNWETPLDYEACILLIVEEYESSPDAVVKALRDAIAADLPSSAPPPYKRSHTTLHIHCLLAKAIGDPALLPELEKLAGSDNKYVRGKAEAAASWLRREVRYPIRYHELKRAFSSQS